MTQTTQTPTPPAPSTATALPPALPPLTALPPLPAPAAAARVGVWPTLRARDARALIRFLVDVLGFEETVVYGDGERVDHAQLDWPSGGGVMLGSVRDQADDPWALPPGTAGTYVVAADVDALVARARAAGTDVVREPHDTDHGSREAALRDPEGNLWAFGTYDGEPRRQP